MGLPLFLLKVATKEAFFFDAQLWNISTRVKNKSTCVAAASHQQHENV